MSWSPISLSVPQYEDSSGAPASGYVLKAYTAGTTTNISMATDSTGGTTFTDIQLNSNGYPEHSGAIVIPHVDQSYKLSLFATQAAADANTPAVWSIDNLIPVSTSGSFTKDDATASDVTNVATLTHTTTGSPSNGIGTGLAFVTETSASNNETGMVVEAVTTDVSAGSEDFKLVLRLMAAGSLADVFEVTSLGSMNFLKANPEIVGGDTDGTFTFGANTNVLGGILKLYGDTHATKAGDVEILSDTTVVAHYDLSATKWTIAQDLLVSGTTTLPTLVAGGLNYPTADGTSNQVLVTNGAGALSFAESPTSVTLSSRTSNTILGAGDNGTLIDITANTFTQTLTAAATLGAGWWCFIRNSGTGDITLDPNGSETIDGLTSYIMYPGETRLVQCNATLFTTVVMSPFYKSFTSSGTFTKPPGYSYFGGLIWSGGSSGEKSGGGSSAKGGGGGGCLDFLIMASDAGATETVTVGAGGASKTTSGGGNVGGDSSVGSLALAYAGGTYNAGGSALDGLASTTPDGYAGASEGAPAISAVYGGGGINNDGGAGAGGSSIYGGGGGASVGSAGQTFTGGTSEFGGGGGASADSTNASAGTQPGGGGGATRTGNSGAGGDGEVRIWGIS